MIAEFSFKGPQMLRGSRFRLRLWTSGFWAWGLGGLEGFGELQVKDQVEIASGFVHGFRALGALLVVVGACFRGATSILPLEP